jgi:nucleotide sugar dehydrogenase
MRAVEAGFDVVGYDPDEGRVKRLSAGDSYVEDVPPTVVVTALDTGRFRPTSDASACTGFDFAVITVPTPLREGSPDLSHVEAAAATVAPGITPGATVILESTTYPGTTEELVVPILEMASGLSAGIDFFVGYSPERIDPGNALYTFRTTPKVVSGINAASLRHVDGFYRRLVDETVPVGSTQVAELTKLLENTFRHVNIALVNELAIFASDLGIDLGEAIDAASTKPFGFMPFRPGPGVGGHCLPIDPSYLAWRVRRSLGRNFRFVELANDVNDHMPHYVVQRLVAGLNRRGRAVSASRILLVGVTYKANASDAREAPSLVVAELLRSMGALVFATDPHVHESPGGSFELRDLTESEVREADAVVLMTDHDDFDFELLQRESRYVLDTRRRLVGSNVERL